MTTHNLNALLAPTSVALIGASQRPGSLGTVVMSNLVGGGFEGPIYPVHPSYGEVQGRAAWPSVLSLPGTPDLAIVCTPPSSIPQLVGELSEIGTRAVAVLTAGLGEAERAALRTSGLRVLGPNSVGLMVPRMRLNATFAHADALPGDIAFISQSGAMGVVILDWARPRRIGFSAFLSLGDALDVDFGDALDYAATDPGTRSILLYIESVARARKFLSAARAAARVKPVVAIKAGRVAEGERAAASHTGAMAGSDELVDYALRRAGVLRVDEIEDLFGAVETLQRLPHSLGARLAILTNGGGPGVMATDALIAAGGALAELAPSTVAALDAVLPPTWSHGNPVDLIGDADTGRYRASIEIVARDPGVDAILVLYAPTAIAPSLEVARAVVQLHRAGRTPILTCWLGGESVGSARALFASEGVASYETPEDAVKALGQLARQRSVRELLMRTPPSPPPEVHVGGVRAREIVSAALRAGRSWLTGPQAMAVLEAYGIPTVAAVAAADAEEAAAQAARIGLPVALKVSSPDVIHKSDIGGVALDLESPESVREAAHSMQQRLATLVPGAHFEGFIVQRMARRPGAQELIVGAAVDPLFGPFVLFGQGGIAVELLGDRAVALPPLDLALADELISRTRVARLLRGFRGRPPADLEAVRLLLVHVSELMAEVPEIQELDLNPVLADEHGVLALDARIAVRRAASAADRLAILPYPRELEERAQLPDGRRVLLRPIRPEDEPKHLEFFRGQSPEELRFRFFHPVRAMPHAELARLTQIDYDREMAFLALELEGEREGRELGVVRGFRLPDGATAEFAIAISAGAVGQGLGRILLEKMIRYLRSAGVQRVVGHVLQDNTRMLRLARSLGFEIAGPPARQGDLEVCLELVPLRHPAPRGR
jgi:acetyltransferase